MDYNFLPKRVQELLKTGSSHILVIGSYNNLLFNSQYGPGSAGYPVINSEYINVTLEWVLEIMPNAKSLNKDVMKIMIFPN